MIITVEQIKKPAGCLVGLDSTSTFDRREGNVHAYPLAT
jgi:hypothetical protein